MLRAVSAVYFESQALELFTTARRDVYKLFRTRYSTAAPASQTVVSGEASAGTPPAAPPPRAPPPPPPPPPRRAWTVVAAAFALTASVGGVYFYQKLSEQEEKRSEGEAGGAGGAAEEEAPYPASADGLPAHVQYLLVGGGTASFAAMRALRSARPEAGVLLVGGERALPYMRPPLSKELWREPGLAARADLDSLTFRQWNGKRRSVSYEPAAFYAPVERLAAGEGGAAVARGWRVVRLDVARHEASLAAPGRGLAVVRYDKCLLATGVRPRRLPALRAAQAAGRSLALRELRDAQRLAAALERPDVAHVTVLGGGFLASELSAALAERLRGSGKSVSQVFREAAPLAAVLPPYLAQDAARRLRAAGVTLLPHAEVVDSSAQAEGTEGVRLRLAGGGEGEGEGEGRTLSTDLVVECVGSEVDGELARNSSLETHPELGGLLVNAELQARSDVYAAGDVACFYDVVLGRRRVEHHDHAVVSGRLAGDNMAALGPPRPYSHQSMFWSDLGPQLGYEAIGIIDSRLPTVGVFSADAVTDTAAVAVAASGSSGGAGGGPDGGASGGPSEGASGDKQYSRGVVFYMRDERVVGVLLWNLFNRMHVARQVLTEGYFEDLMEVAKLFSLHEEE